MTTPIDPVLAQRLRDSGNVSDNVWENWAKNYAATESQPVAPVVEPEPIAPEPAPSNFGDINAAIDVKLNKLGRLRDQLRATGIEDEKISNTLGAEMDKLTAMKQGDQAPKQPELSLTTDAPTPPVADQTTMPGGTVQAPAGQIPMPQTSLVPTPGIDLQMQAVAEQAAVGHAKGMDMAAQYETMRKEMKRIDDDYDKEVIAAEAELEKARIKLDDETTRVSALKVDPNAFWGERSTGQKIALGIGLALGAIGASRTGVNSSVNVINQAIDRDIQAQKANILQQTRGLAQKRGIYSDMRAAFNNDRMAYLATKKAYLERAQLEVQRIASSYQGQEMQARSKQLIGQFQSQKDQIDRQYMAEAAKNMPVAKDQRPKDPELAKRWIQGYGMVTTEKDREPAIELIGTMNELTDSIGKMIEISKVPGASVMPNYIGDANLYQSMMIGALNRKITGGGPLSESEMALVKSIIPNPTAVFSLSSKNRSILKSLMGKIERDGWNKLRLRGLKKATDKYDEQDVK